MVLNMMTRTEPGTFHGLHGVETVETPETVETGTPLATKGGRPFTLYLFGDDGSVFGLEPTSYEGQPAYGIVALRYSLEVEVCGKLQRVDLAGSFGIIEPDTVRREYLAKGFRVVRGHAITEAAHA